MLTDMNARHLKEHKRTSEFLRYALGNRAPAKAKNVPPPLASAGTSMVSASQLHNQSILSAGPSNVKARQRSQL